MDNYRYVILGGGMVAGYAARELAERGIGRGELAIVSSDDAMPYERPPLSKGFLRGDEDEASLFINDRAFYEEHGVALHLETTVEHLDSSGRKLLLRGGGEVGFERLLVATGARVRTLDAPGAGLVGIYYLRGLDDSKAIRAAAQESRRAVVLGGSFIGMEVAAVLSQLGLETTLAFPDDRVWKRFFTAEMSAFFERYYEDRGVLLARGERAVRLHGEERVEAVEFESGRRLPADLVVAGLGVTPAVEVLDGAGLAIDGGVVVNEYLETNVPGVLAAGDVANFFDVRSGTRRRLEHWDNAVEQGKHAARVLLGQREPFVHVPYFFSDVFDLSYEFWGATEGADEVVTAGDVRSPSFSVWWSRGDQTVAAFVMNRPDEERALAQELISGSKPLPLPLRS
ncbi:MAG: FAD-dependent oxidoreductase [Dehalococcoidia bacterium]|nr:FAD-dependent oxidoreductase [Dehalococcoidia bacterium]